MSTPEVEELELLLVEDSPNDAELTMRALKNGGLANKLVWVKDGKEALEYLFCEGDYADRVGTAPRLVLLDLKMPKLGGMEVLAAVKADKRTKRIPVVIMTSSQEEKDVAQAYDMGVNSYVVKPVDFKSLTQIVQKAGYYWLAINKTPFEQ
jgi:two-component system, response regulator